MASIAVTDLVPLFVLHTFLISISSLTRCSSKKRGLYQGMANMYAGLFSHTSVLIGFLAYLVRAPDLVDRWGDGSMTTSVGMFAFRTNFGSWPNQCIARRSAFLFQASKVQPRSGARALTTYPQPITGSYPGNIDGSRLDQSQYPASRGSSFLDPSN